MLRAVITADLTVPVLEGSGALEGIILPGVQIFPDIFQGGNDLKGGAWRVEPLGSPVLKNGAVRI